MNAPIYEERVSSRRTEALFLGLALLFLALSAIRVHTSGFGYLAATFLFLSAFFVFYAVNYRELVVQLSPKALVLRFGIFSWVVPWDSVRRCYRDGTSLWRIGGAGIHFTPIHGRYRAFFNFLEHPRVVLELSKAKGLVREVAFSTRHPDQVLAVISERLVGATEEAGQVRPKGNVIG